LLTTERNLDSCGHVNNAAYLQIFEEARWDCDGRLLVQCI
jgi:acyl-CoA thioesterase FadM